MMNLFAIEVFRAHYRTVGGPGGALCSQACMRCSMSAFSGGPSLAGCDGAKDVGVPCGPNWGGDPLLEPKLPSPKANCPGAPPGLPNERVALRGGVACESCHTGTCMTSVRATLKKSPTLDMSWSPAPGKPSTISAIVGKPCPCWERGVRNPMGVPSDCSTWRCFTTRGTWHASAGLQTWAPARRGVLPGTCTIWCALSPPSLAVDIGGTSPEPRDDSCWPVPPNAPPVAVLGSRPTAPDWPDSRGGIEPECCKPSPPGGGDGCGGLVP